MADDPGTPSSGNDGPHAAEIRRLAVQIRERFADLRLCEVLDMWGWDADDVDQTGDNTLDALEGSQRDRAEGWEAATGRTLGAEFDYIIDLFEKYTAVTPQYAHDGAYEQLSAAARELNPDAFAGDLDQIGNKIGEWAWTGHAADDFRNNFLDDLYDVAPSQLQLIYAVRNMLEGQRNLETAAHTAARDIAKATLEALDNAIAAADDDELSASDVTAVMTILGTVLAVGAMFVPGTQGWALTLALLGAVKEVGNAGAAAASGMLFQPEAVPQPQEFGIGGTTVAFVAFTMRTALISLDAAVQSEQATLVRTVRGDLDTLDGLIADVAVSGKIRARRPGLVSENPSENDFHHRD